MVPWFAFMDYKRRPCFHGLHISGNLAYVTLVSVTACVVT